jgi:hypothetical protein
MIQRVDALITSCSIERFKDWKVGTHDNASLVVECPQDLFIWISRTHKEFVVFIVRLSILNPTKSLF